MTNKLILNNEIRKYVANSFSSEDFEKALEVLATPPLFTTLRVNTLLTSVPDAIAELKIALKKQYEDRNLKPPTVSKCSGVKDLVVVQGSGPNVVQELPLKVIVGLACGESVMRGANVFAQGVMGTPACMKVGDKVSVYADLEGSCLKGWTKSFTSPTVYLGNAECRMQRSDLFNVDKPNQVKGLALEMSEPIYTAPSLQTLSMIGEKLFPQNLPSVICGHVVDPKPGNLVLDMCAAPGGKTGHMACLMKNQGRIIALDKSKNRVKKMKDCLNKLQVTCVESYVFDSTKCIDNNSSLTGAPPYAAESFDRVLLDAPCSALGQRPSMRNTLTLCEISSFPKLQMHLFETAIRAVKPDGFLVYSTCTVTFEENENMVSTILGRFPEIELVQQRPLFGEEGRKDSKMLEQYRSKVQYFNCEHSSLVKKDTICFFIAKFKKIVSIFEH